MDLLSVNRNNLRPKSAYAKSTNAKSSRPGARFSSFSLASGVSFLTLAASLVFAPGLNDAAFAAGATPSGGQFAAGAGAIAPTANGLSITQSTSRGIIDWQSFSIGQGNTVNIVNGSGATLNRVTGGNISNIAGSLTSTGSVYVINPAGIVVMPTGQVVTTGSFVASTRDISDSSFMAGGAQNFKGASSGTVVNQGSITSTNGDVILVGQSVTNSGQISAPNGTVGLAAGDDILLQPSSDPEIVINAGTGDATNSGNIAAAQAELAAAGGNVYALATNNGGVIRATGSATKDGHVYLTAGGNVTVTGTVSATNADGSGGTVKAIAGNAGGLLSVTGAINLSAVAASAKGGTATLTGNTVNIGSTAIISANGGTDGGTIFIGGDRHGGTDPSVALSATPIPNAQYTTVSAGANIAANGGYVAGTLLGGAGNGGNVVVWSNISTSYAGAISAQGGPSGGNGGFVEVSGEQLAFTGTVNTAASSGVAGTLLLDPDDVTIISSTDNSGVLTTGNTNESVSGGTFTPTGTGNTAAPAQGGANSSYILNTIIDTALASNNVVINTGSLTDGNTGSGNVHFGTANGNIGSNAAPLYWTSNSSLTINALGTIDTIGGAPTSATGTSAAGGTAAGNLILIETTGTGSITMKAGGNGLASGATAITWGAPIVAAGGTVTLETTAANDEVIISNFTGQINNTYVSSSAPGNIMLIGDNIRFGSGNNFSGTVSTTGDVIVEPATSGPMIVGNTSSQGPLDSGNTATIDSKSLTLITANTLVLGGSNVTNLKLESTTAGGSNGISVPNVSNLELIATGGTTNGMQSVSQDALSPLTVGSAGTGGLSIMTSGTVSMADFYNTFGSLAIQQVSGGSGGAIAVQGDTTNTNTGTLNIGTVGEAGTGYVVSGITAPNAAVTLLNIGTTTQDTAAAAAISANSLILEGGANGNYTSYLNFDGSSHNYSGTLNGSYTLNNTSNAISNIAGSVSTLSLTNNAALTVATLSDNMTTLTQNSGNQINSTSFSGITGTGAITVVDNGLLTIANGAPIVTPGGNVLLEDQTFTNSDGTSAFNVSGAGNYWRVYSQDPRNDSDGALDATTGATHASFVQYAAPNTYGDPGAATTFTNANAVLTATGNYGNGTGNGFLYSVSPTVTESVSNSFSKVYDGTTTYTGSGASENLNYNAQVVKLGANTVTNLGAGGVADTVTLNKTAAMTLPQSSFYPSPNAGSYNLSTLPGVSISLASAVDTNNVTVYGYSVSPNVSATATITKALLTVTGTKVYDTTNGFATNQLTATGVDGEIVTLSNGGGTSSSPNASTYTGANSTLSNLAIGTVTAGGSSANTSPLASNYNLPTTGTLTITQAPVSITGSKSYNGSTSAPSSTFSTTLTGVYAADALDVALSGSGTLGSPNASVLNGYSSANTGTTNLSLTGLTLGAGTNGNASGNYVLTSGTYTVTKAALTLTPVAVTTQYNATTLNNTTYSDTLSNYTISGFQNNETATGDGLALSGSMAFTVGGTPTAVRNAGTYNQGAGTLALTTTNGNYSLNFTNPTPNNYVITQAPVTVSGTKIYDSTTTASYSTFTSPVPVSVATGVLAADTGDVTITASGSATLGSANAGSYSTANGASSVSNGITLNTLGITLSGSAAGNYSLVGATYTVTKAPLTITAVTQTKVYDGTTTSTGAPTITAGSLQGSDTLTGLSQSYGSPNVLGTNLSTLSVNGGYTLANSNDYTVTLVTAPGTITQAALTLTPVAVTTQYNATTLNNTTYSDTLSNYAISGFQNGESAAGDGLALSGAMAFTVGGTPTAVRNAATYNQGAGTLALTTTNGNYSLNFTNPVPHNYVITQAPVTVSGSKTYDGSATASYSTFTSPVPVSVATGVLAADSGNVTITASGSATLGAANAGSYSTANGASSVSNGMTLNGLGITLNGSAAGNYYLAGATYTIAPVVLTVTNASGGKVYDGTTAVPAVDLTLLSNLQNGDTLGGTGAHALTISGTGLITSANVGTYTGGASTFSVAGLTLNGADAGNYTLGAGSFTVTSAPLTITAVTQTKTYDGTTTSTGTPTITAGSLKGSDTLTGLSQFYTSPNVLGTNNSTLSVGSGYTLANSGNYNVTLASAPGTITPEAIVITAVPTTKTYDGTPSSPGTPVVTSGIIYPADPGTLTQTYGGPNAGTGLTLTPTGTFTNSTNYTVTYVPVMTGVINPAPLTLSGTRVYDGQTDASGSILTASGEIPGDPTLTVSGTGTVGTDNVGTTPLASLGSLTLVGSGSGNYTISNGTVTITPAQLVLAAVNTTKVYDGGVSSNGTPVVTGLIGSDTISALTQTYNSRNVLGTNGSTLTVSPGYTITDGNGGGNYTVVAITSPGTITPEPITVIGTPVSKPYDRTPGSPGVPIIINGRLYGPDIGIFTETYGGPNAGTNLTLTPTGTITDGNGGGNYVVTYVPVTTGTITPLPVILFGTRVYDSTTNAAASILTFTNDLDGSNLTLSGTGTLIAPTVGLEPISSFTGLALGGSAAGNYTLAGAIGNVQVTPVAPTQVLVPLNQTASGVSEVPSDFTIYDGGILYVKSSQNGIVTGTIATIDGQAYQPDNQLGCTLSATGACVESGIAPTAGRAPAGAR